MAFFYTVVQNIHENFSFRLKKVGQAILTYERRYTHVQQKMEASTTVSSHNSVV